MFMSDSVSQVHRDQTQYSGRLCMLSCVRVQRLPCRPLVYFRSMFYLFFLLYPKLRFCRGEGLCVQSKLVSNIEALMVSGASLCQSLQFSTHLNLAKRLLTSSRSRVEPQVRE